eukprot:3675912-Pyramimonas_sp.AAC.1
MKRKKATPKSEAQPPAVEEEGPPEEPLVPKGKAKPKGKPKGKPKPKVEAEEEEDDLLGDDDDEAGSEWDLSGEDDNSFACSCVGRSALVGFKAVGEARRVEPVLGLRVEEQLQCMRCTPI